MNTRLPSHASCAVPAHARPGQSAFTMVEIALCLAIIGFALVALIGILPAGLTVQKENRQDTTINNDAVIWLDALRSGSRTFPVPGAELNLVSITNWTTEYNPETLALIRGPYPRGLDPTTINPNVVLGLLSTPRTYVQDNVLYSNHVMAVVRAFTAPAVNLPPQANLETLDLAFTYLIEPAITPAIHTIPTDPVNTNLVQRLGGNLSDVQLTFRYPLLASGRASRSRTFRTTVSGQLLPSATYSAPAAAGGWSANLYAFHPGLYYRPEP